MTKVLYNENHQEKCHRKAKKKKKKYSHLYFEINKFNKVSAIFTPNTIPVHYHFQHYISVTQFDDLLQHINQRKEKIKRG